MHYCYYLCIAPNVQSYTIKLNCCYAWLMLTKVTRLIYQHSFIVNAIIGLLLVVLFSFRCDDIEQRDNRGRTELYLAAEQGELSKVSQLLAQGANVDARDDCQWTPLMRAAQNGHLSVVRNLLQAGADINAVDKEGYNALIAAVITGQATMVKYLVHNNIELNVSDHVFGWTALIWVVKEGGYDIAQLLIAARADISIRDTSGKNAYHWALLTAEKVDADSQESYLKTLQLIMSE